jgi:NAD(P)-dependent dehydrogenase (short-subunit alcohol dehydrogenase family)
VFPGKSFTDYTLDDYVLITSVNLTGFFHLTQRVSGQMMTQGSGHVVNVTTSLVDNPNSKTSAALPALTKGGLAAVTRSLAVEYASRGIRVNAVALGVIRTRDDPTSYWAWQISILSAGSAKSATLSTGSSTSNGPPFTGETPHIDGGQAAGH